mmetsp:Transcript_15997/g.44634  ORF Transcript_15997/g.44634 Transcript_15997/m.44634 type:complete len:254 (-) Transcript_15997:129-890(-)
MVSTVAPSTEAWAAGNGTSPEIWCAASSRPNCRGRSASTSSSTAAASWTTLTGTSGGSARRSTMTRSLTGTCRTARRTTRTTTRTARTTLSRGTTITDSHGVLPCGLPSRSMEVMCLISMSMTLTHCWARARRMTAARERKKAAASTRQTVIRAITTALTTNRMMTVALPNRRRAQAMMTGEPFAPRRVRVCGTEWCTRHGGSKGLGERSRRQAASCLPLLRPSCLSPRFLHPRPSPSTHSAYTNNVSPLLNT